MSTLLQGFLIVGGFSLFVSALVFWMCVASAREYDSDIARLKAEADE